MKDSCFKTLSASELLEMTNDPKFCRLVLQEHAKVMETPLRGTTVQSSKKENSKKNRFSIIPCWDHSLVLIWEQQSQVIVSLTDIDRDHEKSYHLWTLSNGSEATFGSFVVKILDVREELSFTKTRVKITNKITDTSREITNFWFTDWPDNSIPTGMEEFLELRNKVNQEQSRLMKQAEDDSRTPGPIVVHCSTGTGWTGTFCAIDNALEQLDKEKEVSVADVVLKIRSQRHSSVFLPEQYAFCYLVLRYVILEEAKNNLLS
nr:PTP [Cotesia vestalis bracovirus]